jgi:hypothetical protein
MGLEIGAFTATIPTQINIREALASGAPTGPGGVGGKEFGRYGSDFERTAIASRGAVVEGARVGEPRARIPERPTMPELERPTVPAAERPTVPEAERPTVPPRERPIGIAPGEGRGPPELALYGQAGREESAQAAKTGQMLSVWA